MVAVATGDCHGCQPSSRGSALFFEPARRLNRTLLLLTCCAAPFGSWPNRCACLCCTSPIQETPGDCWPGAENRISIGRPVRGRPGRPVPAFDAREWAGKMVWMFGLLAAWCWVVLQGRHCRWVAILSQPVPRRVEEWRPRFGGSLSARALVRACRRTSGVAPPRPDLISRADAAAMPVQLIPLPPS
jgi:hypothetical protein